MKLMKKFVATILSMVLLVNSSTVQASGSKMSEEDVYAIAIEVGNAYNISPDFLTAMAFYESSYNPKISNGNCVGLMQVNKVYHQQRVASIGVDILDPKGNMYVAADLLAELFEECDDPSYVLARYNGQKNAKRNYEAGVISKYAQRILSYSEELERKHGI